MKISVSNKKSNATASIEEIENNVLIMDCDDSYRFHDNETVELTTQHVDTSALSGTVLTSNPKQLYIEVTDNVLEKLDLSERRKTPRFNASPPIPCILLEHHASGFVKHYKGVIHDLSVNGFKISSEYPLAIKQTFVLTVSIENHNLNNFSAEITIRNSRFEVEYDEKHYGTTIDQINWDSQEKLNHTVAEIQKQAYFKPNFMHKLRSMMSR